MALLLKCRKCKRRDTVVTEAEFIENPTCEKCGGRWEVITRGVPHSKGKELSHLEKTLQLLEEARRELHKGKTKKEIDLTTYQCVLELLTEAMQELQEEDW